MPFDRLVKAVDQWCGENRGEEVFAQIGEGVYLPRHMKWVRSLEPSDFRVRCSAASLLVSHAGMGTVITAAEVQRPLIVMPRRADLMEVTSDHQLATAAWLGNKAWIRVASDEQALVNYLNAPPVPGTQVSHDPLSRDRLIAAVARFIDAE